MIFSSQSLYVNISLFLKFFAFKPANDQNAVCVTTFSDLPSSPSASDPTMHEAIMLKSDFDMDKIDFMLTQIYVTIWCH